MSAVSGEGETNAINYDKNSNVTSINSSTGNTTIGYDANNQQTATTLNTNNVNYTYDSNGQVNQIKTTITKTGQIIANTFTRDAEGKIILVTKGNGDTSSFAYDNSARATSITNRNALKVLQSKYSYQYDANSNVTAVYEDRTTSLVKYSYDARDQLVNDNGITYSYDKMGNRVKMVSGATTTTYTYDALDTNRLVNYSSGSGSNTSFEYDKNGNITKQTVGTAVTQYFYDSDDYFTKAILPDGSTVEYQYDKVFKHRVQRTETSADGTKSIIKFNWDEDRLVSEVDDAGNLIRSYTWDENESLCSITIPDTTGVLKTYYYLKNGKGDIVGLSDQSGNKVVDYNYDAWGKVTKSTVVSAAVPSNLDKLNPRLYSGYWYDAKLGLYVMRARMYNPIIGRFMSTDPMQVGTDSLDYSPYIYCGNNPVTRIDPSGKFAFLAPLVVFALAALPVVVQYLSTLVNTPALIADIDANVRTATDKSKSTTQRVVGGFSAAVGGLSGGEGRAISQSSKAARIASNATKGRMGEKAAQEAFEFTKNTNIIQSIRRIPDGIKYLDKNAVIWYEVKNVRYQSYTAQLRDMIDYATKNNIKFNLVVREGGRISSTLQELVNSGKIVVHYIKMPY